MRVARTAREKVAKNDLRGQSLVELALVIPLVLFMALAVFDFARAFTTAITIEAAAREAADFGGLYPWHWNSTDPASVNKTIEQMQTRACTAASTLADYEGDDPSAVAPGDPVTCTNPTFDWDVIPAPGPYPNCYDVPRDEVPCRIQVTLEHDFHVIIPLNIRFGDTTLGLPSEVPITKNSTFAVSNFELDETLAP